MPPITEPSKFSFPLPANCWFNHLSELLNMTNSAMEEWALLLDTLHLALYVRKLLRHCDACNKLMGKPCRVPDTLPLPEVRVTESAPFTVTGVDFTGALFVKVEKDVQMPNYLCCYMSSAS